MAIRVLVARSRGALGELESADGEFQVVGYARRLADAEEAMRRLRPSVLVLDAELCHHAGLCALPALRRASPSTAIVLPPEGQPGPRLVRAVRLASGEPARRRQHDGLTARERDIVQLAALGHSNREIADRLVLSVRTVETHRSRIRHRLGLDTRAALVRWALEHGLLAS